MSNLSTHYLGLSLANPLVPSAGPLSKDLTTVLQLEDAGAPALVLHSLFEEKIESEASHRRRFLFQQSIGFAEADSFHPQPANLPSYQEQYLAHLQKLKQRLAIPVIASLNGTTLSGWLDVGRALQEAGADAIELNIYHVPVDPEEDSRAVENRYIDILQELKRHIRLPIAVKLSAQFSAPVHFAKQLQQAGADGLVLFNRFYQPDIDLDSLQVVPKLELSTSAEALLRIRWIALMYGRVACSLAAGGGFHQSPEIIKALLAGADVVQLCSVLLQQGSAHLKTLLCQLDERLEAYGYDSVSQLKGSVSQQNAIDPSAFERANYIQVLDNYSSPPGVLR